ncbi:aldehyde dehydrogenase family protein, partial [Rhizobium ruizarguesonis]
NRIYVQSGVYAVVAEKLAAKGAALKVGEGTQMGVTIGQLIDADAIAKVEDHISDAVAKGAKVVAGGKRQSLGGTFFEPTVLAGA